MYYISFSTSTKSKSNPYNTRAKSSALLFSRELCSKHMHDTQLQLYYMITSTQSGGGIILRSHMMSYKRITLYNKMTREAQIKKLNDFAEIKVNKMTIQL